MKEIPLSPNGRKYKGKYVALVDDEDYDWLNKWIWNVKPDGKRFYAHSIQYNWKTSGKRGGVTIHRLILGFPEGEIDHVDGDGLNNQRDNLRVATKSENLQNQGRRGGKHTYRGVRLDTRVYRKKPWEAYISLNGKKKFIGMYETEVEAALAYNEAALEHYGDFSQLNEVI